jgi:protein-S-isoprenylcysteine O-methyltransferase Ste14
MDLKKISEVDKKRLNSFLTRFKFFDVVAYVVISSFIFWYFWNSSLNNYVGIVLFFVGAYIWMRGLYDLGDSFGLLPIAKRLVSKGIYSRVSHPVYFGAFVVDVGLSVYSLHWFVILFSLLLVVVQLLRIKKEEEVLLKKFGAEYARYKRRVWF